MRVLKMKIFWDIKLCLWNAVICSDVAVRTSNPTCRCTFVLNFLFIHMENVKFRPARTS